MVVADGKHSEGEKVRGQERRELPEEWRGYFS